MIAGQALLDLFLAAARWKQKVRYEVVSRSLIEPYALAAGAIAAFFLGFGELRPADRLLVRNARGARLCDLGRRGELQRLRPGALPAERHDLPLDRRRRGGQHARPTC